MEKDQADAVADTYHERVLRNEGELDGLKQLVAETRESDQKLVDYKSEKIATELERTRIQLRELSQSEREADNREHANALAAHIHHSEGTIALLREQYDTLIRNNYEESRDALKALEDRKTASHAKTEQAIALIHSAEREARELQAIEYERRLDELNHAHEKQLAFQAASVTRELWSAAEAAMDTKIEVVKADLRKLEQFQAELTAIDRGKVEITTARQVTQGQMVALAGVVIAFITTVIIIANIVTSR